MRASWLVAVAFGVGACSNSDSPGDRALVDAPRAAPATCNADLSKLQRAVFVSTLGTDGASCGQSVAAPCATIQQGIDQCSTAGCGVLVRHGLYRLSAPVALRDAVDVYGSCLFDGEPSVPYWSVVAAPPDGAPALTAQAIDSPTVVHGLMVVGSDATTPGRASVAMTVAASKGLALSRVQLASGNGADGAPGATTDGGAGGNGSGTPDGIAGGAGGPSCDATGAGAGGQGADLHTRRVHDCVFSCTCSDPSPGSLVGRFGLLSGSVPGGAGGTRGRFGCGCGGNRNTPEDGMQGQGGGAGACGTTGGNASANSWGGVTTVAWVPAAGGSGGAGAVGSGGGGGGAGAFSANEANRDGHPGQPGGGGGAGGCAGSGGVGGQQGGASIPLVLVGSNVGRDATVLVPAVGGNGGAGGSGGRGGPGGAGAPGAPGHSLALDVDLVCHVFVPGAGGAGGPGGPGGAGGGGAGGNGGPSVGLLVRGVAPSTDAERVYRGLPGSGNTKGTGGRNAADQCAGADGVDGVAGGSAVLSGNLMLPGERLAAGQSRASSDGRFVMAHQGDGNLVVSRGDGSVLWASGTAGSGAATAVMQADGNLCLYTAQNAFVWCSNTAKSGAYLVVQEDGNVVIYAGSTALWSTNTPQVN